MKCQHYLANQELTSATVTPTRGIRLRITVGKCASQDANC